MFCGKHFDVFYSGIMALFRRNVSSMTKKRVAYEQKYKCAGCNEILPPTYEVDHIHPLFLGGSNHASNLQALCPGCHSKKTMGERERSPIKCRKCDLYFSPYFMHVQKPIFIQVPMRGILHVSLDPVVPHRTRR